MNALLKLSILSFLSVFWAFSAHSSDLEGEWFLHEFGELRAYHGDFLNVCSGGGFRSCRTVQYGFDKNIDDTFFGSTRLSVARTLDSQKTDQKTGDSGGPIYTIEIFIRDLADVPEGPFTLSIDSEIFQLSNDDWQAGSPEGYNVAETFSIINQKLVGRLVTAMRNGNSMRVLYDGWKETRFQLRGISSALDAIEKRISTTGT